MLVTAQKEAALPNERGAACMLEYDMYQVLS